MYPSNPDNHHGSEEGLIDNGPQFAPPASFSHHNEMWYRHTAGDDCPCEGTQWVKVLRDCGSTDEEIAAFLSWEQLNDPSREIVGWRPIRKPEPILKVEVGCLTPHVRDILIRAEKWLGRLVNRRPDIPESFFDNCDPEPLAKEIRRLLK